MRTFCGLTTDGMLDYLAAIFHLAQNTDKVTTGVGGQDARLLPRLPAAC